MNRVLRDPVRDEDIQAHHVEGGVTHVIYGKIFGVFIIVLGDLKIVALCPKRPCKKAVLKAAFPLFLFDCPNKLFVLAAHHHDVDVVIPGHKALVAHRTQKSSPRGHVSDAVFFAQTGEFLKHFQKAVLQI